MKVVFNVVLFIILTCLQGSAWAGCAVYDTQFAGGDSGKTDRAKEEKGKKSTSPTALGCDTLVLPLFFGMYEMNGFTQKLELVEVWAKSDKVVICRNSACDSIIQSMRDAAMVLRANGFFQAAQEAERLADEIDSVKEFVSGMKFPCPGAGEGQVNYISRAREQCVSVVMDVFPVNRAVAYTGCTAYKAKMVETYVGLEQCQN